MLWLWCRPAAAAPIRPIAWEHSYAAGMALKRQKTKDKKKKKRKFRKAVKSWPFEVDCYRHYCLASRLGARDSDQLPGLATP